MRWATSPAERRAAKMVLETVDVTGVLNDDIVQTVQNQIPEHLALDEEFSPENMHYGQDDSFELLIGFVE